LYFYFSLAAPEEGIIHKQLSAIKQELTRLLICPVVRGLKNIGKTIHTANILNNVRRDPNSKAPVKINLIHSI